MQIKCWGARGSIPVSGEAYQNVGGDTSCIEVRKDDHLLIIDAGTGIRELGKRLLQEKTRHIHLLFTHAHWDHLVGFPFFKPLYSKDVQMDIYGPSLMGKSFRSLLMAFMAPPYFPITLDAIHANLIFHDVDETPFQIGPFHINPILLNHPDGGLGYKISDQKSTIVFLTDNELGKPYETGHSFQVYEEFVRNADLLIHDAMWTPDEYPSFQGWGHSQYQDVLRLALGANVKQLGLFHHHQDRTDADFISISDDCTSIIQEAQSELECLIMRQGWKIQI